jgi:hypothetical protein
VRAPSRQSGQRFPAPAACAPPAELFRSLPGHPRLFCQNGGMPGSLKVPRWLWPSPRPSPGHTRLSVHLTPGARPWAPTSSKLRDGAKPGAATRPAVLWDRHGHAGSVGLHGSGTLLRPPFLEGQHRPSRPLQRRPQREGGHSGQCPVTPARWGPLVP